MPKILAALMIILWIGMVVTRIIMLRRRGVEAMNFGMLDKTDFIIPPLALFFFYLVFAHALSLPTISRQEFFQSAVIAWVGVGLCLVTVLLMAWCLVSFGHSFRVGIDTQHPDKLVTTGIYAYSRNPIYVAFAIGLLGQWLVFPNWIVLLFLLAAGWLFNRQVRREEGFLKIHYGEQYAQYCSRVRRYL